MRREHATELLTAKALKVTVDERTGKTPAGTGGKSAGANDGKKAAERMVSNMPSTIDIKQAWAKKPEGSSLWYEKKSNCIRGSLTVDGIKVNKSFGIKKHNGLSACLKLILVWLWTTTVQCGGDPPAADLLE